MTNCPNCNAPIEPYKCKCDYCGTFYFDFSGIDLTNNKPCYIKVGNVTALARPQIEQIENHNDYATYIDVTGMYHSALVSNNINLQVRFDVLEYKEQIGVSE